MRDLIFYIFLLLIIGNSIYMYSRKCSNIGVFKRRLIHIPLIAPKTLLIILLIFQCQTALSSEESIAHDLLVAQREHFQSAHDALKVGDKKTYLAASERLGSYPIKHYLVALEILQRIYSLPKDDVRKFLKEHKGTAIADDLRYHWLEVLRKRDIWKDYLVDYSEEKVSTKQRCYYQLARIKRDKEEVDDAILGAIKLWSAGKSQPKECDKLFDIIIKKGYITEDIAWQRYIKSILNRQYQLSQYLLRFISDEHHLKLAPKLYRIYRDASTVTNHNFFTGDELNANSTQIHKALAHGLSKMARKDASKSLLHFNAYKKTHNFNISETKKIIASLVKGLRAQSNPEKSDQYLVENKKLAANSLLEWRTRQSIRSGDWINTLFWIENMPEQLKNKQAWRYWRQRSYNLTENITLNNKNSFLASQEIYKNLSPERSFYGFLSSQWLGIEKSMNHKDSTPDLKELLKLERSSGVVRTRELLHHKQILSARREWNKTSRNFNKNQWVLAAHLAKKWEWHNGAITSMIKAKYWDDTNVRFPVSYNTEFEKYSKFSGVPKHWLIALARQESAFHEEASSPAGARGLMQLMPSTAQDVATKNNIEYKGTDDLYNPDTNIGLGSLYFGEMLKRFKNSRILAIAAYNAGPSRAKRWHKKTGGKLPFDAWIEAIPFNETRNYVQNVLAFSAIYAKKIGVHEQMISEQEKILKL
jgi:soluble lytic murein transglycosylase